MFQGRKVPTMHKGNTQRRSSHTLLTTSTPLVRNPQENNIRSRPQVHVTFLENHLRGDRYTTKPKHSLPPTNRRSNRTNERLGRTIPTKLGKRKTRQLGRLPSTSQVCPQLVETRNLGKIPPQVDHWDKSHDPDRNAPRRYRASS